MGLRIAIDLNDVIRDYTDNFIKTYLLNYNREFDTANLDIWTNDLECVLPFKTKHSYNKFVYEDYSYELFGKCDTCTKHLPVDLNEFLKAIREDYEDCEIMFVSTMEGGPTIGYTYFFISKLNCDVREVYMPSDSSTIWDRCDILITANPSLIESKPEGKKVIKIEKDYNTNAKADYSFKTFGQFAKAYYETEDNNFKIKL